MDEAALPFPCWLTNFITGICLTLWPYPVLFRAAKTIVVGRPTLRRQYMRYLSNAAMRKQVLGIFGLLVVGWAATTPFPLCHNEQL
jgi:hypothetical protein